MANYIEKEGYHKEMVKSKKQDKLTDKAIELFQIHAKEVAKMFFFETRDDESDAISAATTDFLLYWKGFKENNMVKFNLDRNFLPKERITFDIKNYKKFYLEAVNEDPDENQFAIGQTVNKSLQSLHDVLKNKHITNLHVSLHKVTQKITFMDITNSEDHTVISSVKVNLASKKALFQGEVSTEIEKEYLFEKPPYSFNHIT